MVTSLYRRRVVKRQHSTRRRCIGLEGAVNTAASSVPLKHELRWEGAAAAKRREPGELGPMPSAAGGVGTPPLAAGMTLDVQAGGYRAMCGRSCVCVSPRVP